MVLAIGLVTHRILAEAQEIADRNSLTNAAVVEAHALYLAFERFYERHHRYPDAYSGTRLEPNTLEPLRSRGYYTGPLIGYLDGHRIDAYDSPGVPGKDREFWIEMTLQHDPSIRILVSRSDDAPMSGGDWFDGAFMLRNGTIEPI
jgi:hypothetical protein